MRQETAGQGIMLIQTHTTRLAHHALHTTPYTHHTVHTRERVRNGQADVQAPICKVSAGMSVPMCLCAYVPMNLCGYVPVSMLKMLPTSFSLPTTSYPIRVYWRM